MEPSASRLDRTGTDIEGDMHRNRALNILFASTGCVDSRIVHELGRVCGLADVSVQVVLDTGFGGKDFGHASTLCPCMPNATRHVALRDHAASGEHKAAGSCPAQDGATREHKVAEPCAFRDDFTKEQKAADPCAIRHAAMEEHKAAELCDWADLLVLAPIDAITLAKMLHGHADNLVLEVIRSWNVSKKILLLPGMSTLMWENPMTKKQLSKIRRKWNWVQVLQPILWNLTGKQKKVQSWDAFQDLVDAIHNQVDLLNIGAGIDLSPSQQVVCPKSMNKTGSTLPPELWTMILDFTGDWELAQTLHIYTNLPPPPDWVSHTSPGGPRNYMEVLELTVLRGSLADVRNFITTHSVPRWLSKLCIKLIMRFAMTNVLSHLEANHKDLFWATFGHTFLPDKASSIFGRTEILEFWRTSPSFLTKEYNCEALDGASRAGFVSVLEWWQHSGLPLKFTEAALEQASSQGHISVLEWWKAQSSTAVDDCSASVDPSKVRLKPGKSICYATQNGHTHVVQWWLESGIAFPHEDTVAKLASTHGQVSVLALWHDMKGSKMIFDNQVLVGATKSGHVGVLEWWKKSGLQVEYKTCDVEEALEDGYEGERGMEVRRWWARNGLNLGVGTSEWMKTKVLNA